MISRQKLSEIIKSESKHLGFDACGIARAKYLEEEAGHLKNWLDSKMHGNMRYMENNFSKRVNPGNLVKDAKSVIVVLLNYYTDKSPGDKEAPVISRYAFGKDYHSVMKSKLYQLLKFISSKINYVSGRAFVDSAPILERAWAAKAGLGWIGKNSNLISPVLGSFVFIGILIIDRELHYDHPVEESCKTCEKCISSCPTGAITEPKVIDARKCISYLTVEYKGTIPAGYGEKFNNRIYGCDICQDICPFNENAKNNNVPEFNPEPALLEMTKSDWYNLNEDIYCKIFKDSVVKRIKFSGLKRNIDFVRSL